MLSIRAVGLQTFRQASKHLQPAKFLLQICDQLCQFSQPMGAPCQTIRVKYGCLVAGVGRRCALWPRSGTEAPNRLGSERATDSTGGYGKFLPGLLTWHARRTVISRS